MNTKRAVFILLLVWTLVALGYYFKTQSLKKAEAPKGVQEDVLPVYHWGEIPKFNPINPDGLYVWWLQNLAWDRLVNMDTYKVWSPHLAHSWLFNEDKTQLTLFLPEDLQWSNARKVEERDFKFSFEYYKDQNFIGAIYGPLLSRIKFVSYQDTKLVISLAENNENDPRYASHVYWSEILGIFRLYPYDLDKNPYVATGAYKVQSFSSRKSWSLVKNKTSWFWATYDKNEFPDHLLVKSIISKSLLKRLIEKTNALVLGVDLYQKEITDWNPLDEKEYRTSIGFNLKKTDRNFRDKISQKINEVNDLEKLNLNHKDFDTSDFKKRILDDTKDINKAINLSVLYSMDSDQVWLVYLQEKLKKIGLNLDLVKVSDSNLNERIINKDFVSYVNTYSKDDFYPHYLTFHSNGNYNYMGWNNAQMDQILTRILDQSSREEVLVLRDKFRFYMDQELFEVPMYSFKSSMLWTRNPCNPIKTQFQRLGLIYKGIVCADNL